MPSDAEYQRAKSAVGWSKLGFSGGQIKKTVDGVELDFGAYGKGEALDQAAIELRKFGIEDAYLSAGESVILALGNEADGRKRLDRIATRSPQPRRSIGRNRSSKRPGSLDFRRLRAGHHCRR